MRAMEPLSNSKAFVLDPIVEQPRTAGYERLGDRGACLRRPVTKQAAAAAGAADLRRRGAGRARTHDEIVDRRSRHAGREALAVLPLCRDVAADIVPVPALQRVAHRAARVANALEAVEDVPVAVDVALGDLPVVRA